jgi:hypothetical protein
MQTVSPGLHRVARERACVLYDRTTGAIQHRCREALTKRGRAHDGLDTLHLDRHAFQPFKVYRVDPSRRVLVEREHKR